jgi:DNA polymerase zeta
VKILEKSLRILFETKDVSKVKKFVQRQFGKILAGKASLQDLTFAKEFRGAAGYKPGAMVPALEITRYHVDNEINCQFLKLLVLFHRRLTRTDRRAVPRTAERCPYVIIYGEPGRPLIQSVRTPEEVLANPGTRPNAQYYIGKVIVPPLNRCLSLVGADAMAW